MREAARLVVVLVLMLVASVLAGCVDDPGDGGDDGRPDPTDPDGGDGDEDDEPELPLVEEPVETTLYLTTGHSLALEAPSAGAVEQGDFLPDYFQGNVDVSDFVFLSEPSPNVTMVHAVDVQVTLFVESDYPHPPIPGFDGTGGGAFFGSGKGMPLIQFDVSDPVFLPGEPVRYDIVLAFRDFVPIVVPAGEPLSLLPVLVATTSDAAPARILVGGDHASAVTFTVSNLTRDPTANLSTAQVESFSGTIENPESPRQSHSFDLAPEAEELHIEIQHTSGYESDFDIDLFDAGGTHISGSHTPATYESIYLMGPALDGLRGTTMSVTVAHFNAVNAEYELTVSQR